MEPLLLILEVKTIKDLINKENEIRIISDIL